MREDCKHRRFFPCSVEPNDPIAAPINPTRRKLISGMAVAGLGAALTSTIGRFTSAFAQTPTPPAAKPHLVDVHHHIIPPFYLAEYRDRIASSRGGQISAAWLGWTPEKALAAMDQQGVATAVLSLSSPGVWFGDPQAARQTARRSNEYASELARSHSGRFGLFAVIPLPDSDGSLREIEYALDVLKADGIGVLTSYGDKWLGDLSFQPVFEELNRRKAVVFVHPTTPNCCRTLMPGIPTVMAEVPHDTTRTVISLLFSGAFTRFKDIRFIFAHAGGTVPMVFNRMIEYAPEGVAEKVPNGVEYELKRHYYDIAGTAHRPAIAALTSLVPMTHILFGSDNPYVALAETAEGMTKVGLSAADLQAIGRNNALALLPRLQANLRI